ncbi:fructosamine kinase family protein [Nocardioides massiliensis]|uniref:Fructosamine-3-kinase n=1 Tax=Nocardioides massiliensis TaxID=1325935 RepID=A0ABT9NN25_9ACTN|nr:fructosamine kinase family protein [Nocardioides massiliensis]MDP9821445.1 fructosamine-3-kinase [Nocardioides massiliensis]
MARQATVARRAEELLDVAVVSTQPVAGGDICTTTRLRLSDGTLAVMKTKPHAPPTFFRTEAHGLRWLAEVDGGAPVPEVLAVEDDCLLLRWIEPGRPGGDAATAFGARLARTHAAGAAAYAGPDGSEADGWIGTLPLPQRSAPTWAEFYAVRRVLPYLKLARDRHAIEPEHAQVIEDIVRVLPDRAGPSEPPARLHGDLWSGNVVWAGDGQVWMLDPAAYAGHRETDLAMLALFGLPQLEQVLTGYQAEAPLAEGWEERVGLHQLFPLLVHACMFGGGYGARAAAGVEHLR